MDPITGDVSNKTVTRIFKNQTDELVKIQVNGEQITSTPSHPFYVYNVGWTAASDLRAGDKLCKVNGKYVVVEWVEHQILENPITVYNFEVEDYHTYFVGSGSVLVHNSCNKTRLPRTNGDWEGISGESNWKSYNDAVNNITNGEPIPFINGRPDFSKWSKGSIEFEEGMLNGTDSDFNLIYKKLKEDLGFNTQDEAKKWLNDNKLTPHHYSSTEIQLIPSDLHNNIPHIGSASDLRNS